MELKDIIGKSVAALVEYYDNSPACDEANLLIEKVRQILGPDAPVYRINIEDSKRESNLVHLKTIPTIILYRNHREEWVLTSGFPSAEVLAERLKASDLPPGAINPLKGHHRH